MYDERFNMESERYNKLYFMEIVDDCVQTIMEGKDPGYVFNREQEKAVKEALQHRVSKNALRRIYGEDEIDEYIYRKDGIIYFLPARNEKEQPIIHQSTQLFELVFQ